MLWILAVVGVAVVLAAGFGWVLCMAAADADRRAEAMQESGDDHLDG